MTKVAIEPKPFPFFDYSQYSFSLGLDTPEGMWLSGHTASRFDPARQRMVVDGDIVEQSRTAYQKICAILEAVGLGFKDVVRTVDYVTVKGIEDYPRTAELRREIFGDSPPATSTMVVNSLLRPEALIEIEVVASRRGHTTVDPGWPSGSFPKSVAQKVGNVLYISALLPVKPGTNEVVGSDIVQQARQIYELAEEVLRAAGLGWENVVNTVEFLTPEGLPSYRETAAVRKEYFRGHYPAATGIIMQRLAHPEAQLQVDFMAIAGKREVINPGWSRYDRLTYVPGVKTGNLLFLSGQGSLNPETQAIEHAGDVVAQSRYIYSNFIKVLEAAGAGPDAVIKTVEFVTPQGLEQYRRTAEVRKELFKPPYPAATGIVCDRLLRPEMLLEVNAIAVLS